MLIMMQNHHVQPLNLVIHLSTFKIHFFNLSLVFLKNLLRSRVHQSDFSQLKMPNALLKTPSYERLRALLQHSGGFFS